MNKLKKEGKGKKEVKKEKKEDFQVKAYQLLYRTLKKLHTFKIQKVVRKLKKDNQRKQELEKEGADAAQIEKVSTEIERLIKQKGKMDMVTKDHLKMITLYNLNQVHNVSLEKDKDFFEKELPGFVDKIELFNDEGNEEIQLIKWFEETIKTHKVYLECQQKLTMLVATMEEIMEKNKMRRKTRKQNKKIRMKQEKEGVTNGVSTSENGDNEDAMNIEQEEQDDDDGGKDIVIEDDDEELAPRKNVQKKPDGKKRQSERYKKFQERKQSEKKKGDFEDEQIDSRDRGPKGNVFGGKWNNNNGRGGKNFNRNDRSQTNDRFNSRDNRDNRGGRGGYNDRERGPRNNQRDFKDRGFNKDRNAFGGKRANNQEFSEEKIEKKVKGEERGGRGFGPRDNQREEKGFRDNSRGGFGKDNQATEKFKPFDQLHPSWRANIEQKQKATITTFQGTKEKL